MDRMSSVTLHFSILDVDPTIGWLRSRFVLFNSSSNIVIAPVKERHRTHLDRRQSCTPFFFLAVRVGDG